MNYYMASKASSDMSVGGSTNSSVGYTPDMNYNSESSEDEEQVELYHDYLDQDKFEDTIELPEDNPQEEPVYYIGRG
jgi:hypothetical protein